MPRGSLGGEYSNPEIELSQRRGRFLQEVVNLIPECLQQLKVEVLPEYISRAERKSDFARKVNKNGLSLVLNSSEPLAWQELKRAGDKEGRILPHLVPLRDALLRWAEAFHLTESDFFLPSGFDQIRLPQHIARTDWALNTALKTLEQWSKVPPEGELYWGFLGTYDVSTPPNLPPPPQFDAALESKEAYERRIRTYADSVSDSYKAAGWQEPSEKRNLDHFVWLVLRHVGEYGASYLSEALSEEEEKEKALRSIQRTVKVEADEMGLHLSKIQSGKRSKMAKQKAVAEIRNRMADRKLRP